jgi:hypothetical protein
MVKANIKSDGKTVTVRVPISIGRRGGRKIVLTPGGTQHDAPKMRVRQVDSALVKAIARSFRWRELLELGECSTVKEIAARERINESYIARILRLSLLAPDVIEAILEGRQPPDITLPVLMKRIKLVWTDQRAALKL